MWSRGETLCVVGLGYSASDGKTQHCLVATPSENLQTSGEAQVCLVLACLQGHPAELTRRALKSRLCIVGGDGAIAAGGSAAKPSSTRAA